MIQEPLAPAVEADGQPYPSSLQLTEELVSNLQREREPSVTHGLEMEISRVSPPASWFSGPTMHTFSQPLALVLQQVIQKSY